MADDSKPIVTRTESEIDAYFDLWKRRPVISLLVLLVLLAPGGFGLYLQFVKVPKLQAAAGKKDEAAKDTERASLAAEQAHRDTIAEKTAKIQELETELGPFRTYALLKYSSSDAEAMRKLAEHLDAIDAKLEDTKRELAQVRLKAELPRLRKIAEIRPNGDQVAWSGFRERGTGSAFQSGSAIRETLRGAFRAMNANDRAAATAAFQKVTEDLPDWPYGHYYLGSLTGDTGSIRRAIRIFQDMREVGVEAPELALYESLCYLWVKEYKKAELRLSDVEHPMMKLEKIPFLAIPEDCPADARQRVSAFAAQARAPLLVWKPAAR